MNTVMYIGSMHGGGASEIGRVIAHSVIWTVVSQFIRQQPGWFMVGAFVFAALWLVSRNRRSRRAVACRQCGRR